MILDMDESCSLRIREDKIRWYRDDSPCMFRHTGLFVYYMKSPPGSMRKVVGRVLPAKADVCSESRPHVPKIERWGVKPACVLCY